LYTLIISFKWSKRKSVLKWIGKKVSRIDTDIEVQEIVDLYQIANHFGESEKRIS